ncbi:hypothetical protein V5799_009357 [Amblyomma americanum]|uniref:Chitin-binding type-2 domain-containing protein n=1 Tax=Amblyomma americanum TaxID=6943 RepID=A0AAQ4FAJ5_AMBAM
MRGCDAVRCCAQVKRLAYELADGADLVVGPLVKAFRCRRNGYFADVRNRCKVYHVCHAVRRAGGSSVMQHFSFFCGNRTVFDQLSMTCTYPDDAVPCRSAPAFFYLNERIGVENALFHTDTDVALADARRPKRRRTGDGRTATRISG